jgi:hypothetical protein
MNVERMDLARVIHHSPMAKFTDGYAGHGRIQGAIFLAIDIEPLLILRENNHKVRGALLKPRDRILCCTVNESVNKPRGIFERPPKSGVWWIQYFANSKRRREKVGRKSDALKLYQRRKAETHAGAKLPPLRNTRGVTISELIDDALLRVQDHKDLRNNISKAEIVRGDVGTRLADSLTPQDLDQWLKEHCKTPATSNRYKAFFSLCYQGRDQKWQSQPECRSLGTSSEGAKRPIPILEQG